MTDEEEVYQPPYVVDPQSRIEKLVDDVVSFFLWAFFLYLMRGVPMWIIGLFDEALNKGGNESGGLLVTLNEYMVIAIMNAIIFILWALYNRLAFARMARRRDPVPLTDDDTAKSFDVAVADLPGYQSEQRMVYHYDEKGKILAIAKGWDEMPYETVDTTPEWQHINNY